MVLMLQIAGGIWIGGTAAFFTVAGGIETVERIRKNLRSGRPWWKFAA